MKKLIIIIGLLTCAGYLQAQWISNYGTEGDGPRTVTRFHGTDNAANSQGYCYVTGYSYNSITGNDIIVIKYSQSGKIVFVRSFEGNANGDDKAFGIAVDEDGSIYITGQIQNSTSFIDLVLLKYDNSGNLLWSRTYSGPGEDKGVSLALDSDHNIIVAGFCTGDDGNKDILVQKYSPGGLNLWSKRIDGEGTLNCQANDLAVGDGGSIYVTGFTIYINSSSPADFITCCLSPSGSVNWTRVFNGSGYEDKAFGITIDEDGYSYVAGYISQDINNTSAAIIKYDTEGNLEWTRLIESGLPGSSDKAWGIAADENDRIYVIGQYLTHSESDLDYFITRYNQSGENIWFKTYNGPGNGQDVSTDLAVMRNGNLVITGYSRGMNNFDYATMVVNWSNGNIHNELRYSMSANSNDFAVSIASSVNNDFYVTGYSEIPMGVELDGSSFLSTLMYKTSEEENSSTSSPSKFILHQNYPNPFNPATKIEFDIAEKSTVKLEVYDILGNVVDILVDRVLEAGNYSFTYKNEKLSSGIYFYKLTAGNFTDVKKMSLIK